MTLQTLFLRLKDALTVSRLLAAANILLLGAVALIGGGFIAAIVENDLLYVPYQPAQYVPPQRQEHDHPLPFSEFNDILEQNVFDAEVASAKQPQLIEATEQALPGKQLNDILRDLNLLGIHYRKHHYIYCIIRYNKKNEESIFTIGDQLFDTGASVYRIFTSFGNERVQIKLGSEIGTLNYVEEEPKAAPVAQRTSPQPSAASSQTGSDPLTSKYTTDGTNFYISATEVDSHLDNFGTLLNQARMVPYFQNNKHQGFRVKAIDKGSLYEKLGLKNDDLLKAVNGESLAEAGGEKLMGMFKLLRNEYEFTVEVERNGKSQVLNYYVN